MDQPWPEFAEYDCFACHHDLRDRAWRRDPVRFGKRPPGSLAWNERYVLFLPDLLSLQTKETKEAPATAAEGKSNAAPGSSAKEADIKDQEKPAFSLQLGAFQTENNAIKLSDNFKSKGYPVFLFRVLDADGHLWHTVRMGHYADMKEATQAAAKMTSKEQISVWVRPSNAF